MAHTKIHYFCGLLFAFVFSGCALLPRHPDHTVEVRNVGKERIAEVTYFYGDMRPGYLRVLDASGESRTMPMTVPDLAVITWTTPDGKKHEGRVPVRAKAPALMHGKVVSFEIDGPTLRVFVGRRQQDSARDRMQIY